MTKEQETLLDEVVEYLDNLSGEKAEKLKNRLIEEFFTKENFNEEGTLEEELLKEMEN